MAEYLCPCCNKLVEVEDGFCPVCECPEKYIGSNPEWTVSGTCQWRVCESILEVEPVDGKTGQLKAWGGPWKQFSRHIQRIVIAPGVQVSSCNALFKDCKSVTSIEVSNLDTSQVSDFKLMFAQCEKLEHIEGIEQLDGSNAKEVHSMFNGCTSLRQVDVSWLDISKVDGYWGLFGMFALCEQLESIDLSTWDTSNITNMSNMFSGCRALTNLDLSTFNTSKVTEMFHLFSDCQSLQTLNLSGFDTSSAGSIFDDMFIWCDALREIILTDCSENSAQAIIKQISPRTSVVR